MNLLFTFSATDEENWLADLLEAGWVTQPIPSHLRLDHDLLPGGDDQLFDPAIFVCPSIALRREPPPGYLSGSSSLIAGEGHHFLSGHLGSISYDFENFRPIPLLCFLTMALHSLPIRSNNVRLPDPQPGEALVVERYSAEHVKAVILHPDDFAELQGDSELLDDLDAASELSDLGARAHRIAESPEGELIDDEASVRRLLGL